MPAGDIRSQGSTFLNSLIDADDSMIENGLRSLDEWQVVLLLSSLLSVSVAERFGASVSLDEISRYAQMVSLDSARDPRRVVVEAVLRAGAGDERILRKLPEDEILAVASIVLPMMVRELENGHLTRVDLVERAVESAARQFEHPGVDR